VVIKLAYCLAPASHFTRTSFHQSCGGNYATQKLSSAWMFIIQQSLLVKCRNSWSKHFYLHMYVCNVCFQEWTINNKINNNFL